MKRCPKCVFETADEEMNFCPHCSYEDGNGPVELIKDNTNTSGPANTVNNSSQEVGGEIHYKENVERVKSSIKTPADSADISGDANAVNIHGDVIKTNDDHATYNISNTTKELTEAEKLRENETSYFNECVRLIHDGFIDDDGQRQLNAMQISLGLNKDRADSIQKNVTAQSVRKRTGLNITVVNLISSAKRSIELNDRTRLLTILKELEAYRGQYDDDNLDHIYYQLKAILSPDAFVKDFTAITNSYWETFWSYIPLLRIDIKKATESLAALERWGHSYPSQNQTVLQTVGLLIQNRLLEARETFKSVVPGYSEDLEPICFSIRELLDKHWDETTDVSLRSKFYVDALYKSAYTSIKQEATDRKAIEIATAHNAEMEAKAIQNKKDNFLIQYEEKNGSIHDALVLAGVNQLQFDEWKRFDANFRMALDTINKRLEENKQREDAKIEERKASFISYYESNGLSLKDSLTSFGVSQEEFSEWTSKDFSFLEKYKEIESRQRKEHEELLQSIKIQKDKFLTLYKSNNCDIQKACSELGLYSGAIEQWRHDDSSFDKSLKLIERLHADLVRKALLTKIFLWLLIVALSIACAFGIIKVSHNYNERKEKTEIEGQYDLAVSNFNTAFSHIDTSDEGLDALSNAASALKQVIGLEHSPYLEGREELLSLKRKFDERVEELLENFQNKASLVPEKGGNEIVWEDGKNGQKRVKEIINTLQQ